MKHPSTMKVNVVKTSQVVLIGTKHGMYCIVLSYILLVGC